MKMYKNFFEKSIDKPAPMGYNRIKDKTQRKEITRCSLT
jgi:hypothetical protein